MPVPDPFIVTDREEKLFGGILAAVDLGLLKLTTGTYKNERAAFLVIDQPGIGFTPVAIVVRESDLPHMRNRLLDPLSPGEGSQPVGAVT